MRDFLNIGSSPIDEPCAQFGTEGYETTARIECRAYMHQLVRTFGPPPYGARLQIKGFEHDRGQYDVGTYYEVVCWFEDSIQEAVDYAFKLEAESPQRWDELALAEIEGRVAEAILRGEIK